MPVYISVNPATFSWIDDIQNIEYDTGMIDAKQEKLNVLFKALMHPARITILDLLRDGEECVCHIEAQLGYRQAYVSQQLAVLRDAGLVEDQRDGWNVYYRVVRPEVFDLLDTARTMLGLDPHERSQRACSPACPCPKCASSA